MPSPRLAMCAGSCWVADKAESITFDAIVSQVRTMADGGIRVVLDLPEGCVAEAACLMQVKQDEGVIRVEITR